MERYAHVLNTCSEIHRVILLPDVSSEHSENLHFCSISDKKVERYHDLLDNVYQGTHILRCRDVNVSPALLSPQEKRAMSFLQLRQWNEKQARKAAVRSSERQSEDAVCVIQFSSGTTGTPKGMSNTVREVLADFKDVAEVLNSR